MQTLLIFSIIIAVFLYIISVYAIVILYKMNKLGKIDKEQQTEFLLRNSKLLIIFTLITLVFFVILFLCYALLVNEYEIELILEFFILFSLAFSVLSIITFVMAYLTPKVRNRGKKSIKKKSIKKNSTKIIDMTFNDTKVQAQEKFVGKEINLKGSERVEKNFGKETVIDKKDIGTFDEREVEKVKQETEQIRRNQEARRQLQKESEWFWEQKKRERIRNELEQELKEKEEKEHNSLKYFEENSSTLIKKYTQSVKNFIEKMVDDIRCPFLSMFNETEIPLSSMLVYPYRNSSSQLLKDKIKCDGLEFTESNNAEQNIKIQNLTIFFISGLKKRIKDNNEWQDDFTFPALLYLIVRNNVIKYYHDEYSKLFGYDSLEEFCKEVSNAISNAAYYVYYYIYENNINLPFVDTYRLVCKDINKILEIQKEQKLENDLFGVSRNQKNSSTKNELQTLSTIEKVDLMTGEQFEIFMTNYFENQGFKTTHTPISGDYGIDLIIENDFGKIGVQAKCYSNKVSLDAVQQVVAGLRHYGLSSGLVITNNYFQPSAIRLAADNNITLWDRDKLIEKLVN